MSDKKKLTKNIALLVVVQFVNYVAPLLVFPFLTRILSLSEFGTVAVAFSICGLAMVVTDFGFEVSGAYWIAKQRDFSNIVNAYLGAVYLIKIMLAIICIFGVFIYAYYYNNSMFRNVSMMTGLAFTILFQSLQTVWFFQGIERMKSITYSLVASKFVYVILILSLVHKKNDSGLVVICLCISAFVGTVSLIYCTFKEGYKITKPSLLLIKETFLSNIQFFLSRAAVAIYTSASVFVVGASAGLVQAGLYSSAEKLYQAGQNVTSPLTQALYPYLARSKDGKTLYIVLLITLPILLSCVGICYYFSADILRIFYVEAYVDAAPILRVFLITSIFTYVSINLGYPAFSIYGRLDLANISVYIASVLHLVSLSTLFLLNQINALHVAYCVCIVEFFVLALRFSMLNSLRVKKSSYEK